MKCREVQDILPDYWDLPVDDWNRMRVDEHVKHCLSCKEDLAWWRESATMIQSLRLEEDIPLPEPGKVSSSVMDRIYQDEGWRRPVSEKVYEIPRKARVRLMALIACCLAMFGSALIYQIMFPESEEYAVPTAGLMSGNALGAGEIPGFSIAGLDGITVASIGDPVVLGLTGVDSYPDYMFVLSMFGLICSLLLMNWFARTRT